MLSPEPGTIWVRQCHPKIGATASGVDQIVPQTLLRGCSHKIIKAVCGAGTMRGTVLDGASEREAAMNKADLVTRIAKDAEITKRQAEKVLDTLMDGVQEALSKGDSITLVGF